MTLLDMFHTIDATEVPRSDFSEIFEVLCCCVELDLRRKSERAGTSGSRGEPLMGHHVSDRLEYSRLVKSSVQHLFLEKNRHIQPSDSNGSVP